MAAIARTPVLPEALCTRAIHRKRLLQEPVVVLPICEHGDAVLWALLRVPFRITYSG
jgi:hypothetical protein